MKYIILGQNASGRNHLAHELEKNGFRIAKTYVTNEAFFENDFMVINNDKINESDIISKKDYVIGHSQIITCEMIDDNDVIIADKYSLADILVKSPMDAFTVIIIEANEENRKNAYKNKKVGFQVHDTKPFREFIGKIKKITSDVDPDNLCEVLIFHNDYTDKAMQILMDRIKSKIDLSKKIEIIAKELIRIGEMICDDNNIVTLTMLNSNNDITSVKIPFNIMIGDIVSDSNQFNRFMLQTMASIKNMNAIKSLFSEE